MSHPDPGPLTAEHLDELQTIIETGEAASPQADDDNADETLASAFEALNRCLAFYDAHGRKLLEAARWALAHGWQRGAPDNGH